MTDELTISYEEHQLDYPIYHCEETLGEDDVVEMYTAILTGRETILETMTLAEYIKRANTKGTNEYMTADQHVPHIELELADLG